ncbi:MAG: ribokinase [Clostridiales bacterium]|nr:ribokinase [Clostridiales bacterium]
MGGSICVFGSYLVGMTMRVPRFPVAGETLKGADFGALHGGKGSNQAIACARLGARAAFAGCVGDDGFGRAALDLFRDEHVRADMVRVAPDVPTGVGFILVNDAGENVITLDTGACRRMTPEMARACAGDIRACDMLLLQLEIPVDASLEAARIAKEAGVPVLLNPAPYAPLPREFFPLIDILTPNQGEARALLGLSPEDGSVSDECLTGRLIDLGIPSVAITRGSSGVVLGCAGRITTHPAYRVPALDTTGAGDTFTAGLAVALTEGQSMAEAIDFAQRAAALCVTRYGVIASLPTRAEVEAFSPGRQP